MARNLKVVSQDSEDDDVVLELGDTLASALREQKTTWLWANRLEWGTVAVFQGEKGAGKSTWLRKIAAHVTGGPLLPGCRGKPKRLGAVLWYAGEESLSTRVLPGLKAAGAKLDHIHLADAFNLDQRHRLALPNDCARLLRRVETTQAALVILDPVFAFSDGTCDLEGPTMPARRFMLELAKIAAATGCLILLTRNLTKDTSRGALSAGRGSAEIANSARSVLHAQRLPDQVGIFGLAVAACNNGRPTKTLRYTIEDSKGASLISTQGDIDISADDLAGGDEGDLDRFLKEKAKLLINSCLAEGRVDSKTVKAKAEESMIGTRTLQSAAKAMGVKMTREGSREATVTYWSLPSAK